MKKNHVCPWWLAYTFDNPLRRLVHKPERILGKLVRPGMRVLDVGCGMGYFTVPMAKLVYPGGTVAALDLQQQMLDAMMRRAKKADVQERITPIASDVLAIEEQGTLDFVLAFWMVHEVPDQRAFFGRMREALAGGGSMLIAEPLFHVTKKEFMRTAELALDAGFREERAPDVAFSRSILLRNPW